MTYSIGRAEAVNSNQNEAVDLTLKILALLLDHIEHVNDGGGVLEN